jgi:Fe(3+) dicitrate transport protein
LIAHGLATAPPDGTEKKKDTPIRLPPIVVSHTPEELSTVGGSVHKVSEQSLETHEYDDPAQVLYWVPGVYLRQEDAYGLRPNIGLRGANSERSKKVTLMEDGVLFGPAPYSAPAAYYFPMMTRAVGMEVFKGPAAILYGPQTIGGAINILTRDIPRGHLAGFDSAYGQNNYLKLHGHYGWGGSRSGVLVEGVHLMTQGFKELDGGGDTGFGKQEIMLKGRLTSDPLADIFHRADIKLGFSNEDSNETYLGLSDSDFRDNPNRRYRASQLDNMDLQRFQVESGYTLQVGEDFDLNLTLYWHDLSRSWRKVKGFKGGPSLSDILANPDSGERQVYYEILTGAQDSSADAETLMLGTNAREYTVLGAQLNSRWAFVSARLNHELRAGLRVHFDQVERDHFEDGFTMEGGALASDGSSTIQATLNRGRAFAVAAYLQHAVHGWGVTIKPGLRMEQVSTELWDKPTKQKSDNSHLTLMPGIGIHYELMPGLGVLGGVYRGFSPVAPGQANDVEPEISINYEFGLRFVNEATQTRLEVIGFFNDYSNMVGQCSFSAGCKEEDLDRQFNAGKARIGGVEMVLAHRFALSYGLHLPLRAAYTFTHATFQSSFESTNPQLGKVEKGDHLPYLPTHQVAFQAGVGGKQWDLDISAIYVSEMYEQAAAADLDDALKTDAVIILDASVRIRPTEWLSFYLKGENLLMETPIVSRRPYGARPGKPFMLSGGLKLRW